MRLQKFPNGFLDAFDLKTDGRAPNELADTLAGTADLAPFYFADEVALATQTGTVTASGAAIAVTVPQGQYWRIQGVSASLSMPAAAAEQMQLGVAWIPPGASIYHYLAANQFLATIGQDAALAVAYTAPIVWIAPPGSRFYAIGLRTYAAARAVTLSVAHWPFGAS